MRVLAVFLSTFWAVNAQIPAPKLWDELATKRAALPAFRQEFEVTRANRLSNGFTKSDKWRVDIDWKGPQWRERMPGNWGETKHIFTGSELLLIEEGLGEFKSDKVRKGEKTPLPIPYSLAAELNWPKAIEVARQPCHSEAKSNTCAIIEIELLKIGHYSVSGGAALVSFRHGGKATLLMDTETGLLLEYASIEAIEENGTQISSELHYLASNALMVPSPSSDAFTPTLTALKAVKTFSIWDARQVTTILAGKPAPEITGVDLNGNPVSLSSLRGKTVLLDFWASWCPPCRTDGLALNKLQEKYGGRNFTIVAISMGENRAVVEKYLAKNPAKYPIVLESDTDLPREFKVQFIPTYVALDANGNFIAATSGAQGLSALKKLLKKAGLNLD